MSNHDTAPLFRSLTRDELLAAADRLDREGDHELAAEARVEAEQVGAPAPAAPAPTMRCEDCGRRTGTSRMPADWHLDWWSHKLNGTPCGGAR